MEQTVPNLLVSSSQNTWIAGLDAAFGESPTPDRIDTDSDVLIGGAGDDMQLGGQGQEILISGFGTAQHQDATEVAFENDSAAIDVQGLAIAAFLKGDY